jgi:hypothetical protein
MVTEYCKLDNDSAFSSLWQFWGIDAIIGSMLID